MNTLCHKQLHFESLFSKEVIAKFEGGRITTDAGGLLLRELDQRCRLAAGSAMAPPESGPRLGKVPAAGSQDPGGSPL